MRLLRNILLFLRLCLLVLLLLYWAAFIGYTIAKFIEGGLGRVAAYYWHVACENRLEPCSMNWGGFWFAQGAYLAITLLLCFFEWRSWRARTPAGRA
jgi:hypothetical protein